MHSNLKNVIFQLKERNSCKYLTWHTRQFKTFFRTWNTPNWWPHHHWTSVTSNKVSERKNLNPARYESSCAFPPQHFADALCSIKWEIITAVETLSLWLLTVCFLLVLLKLWILMGLQLFLSKSLVLVSVAIKSNKSSTSCKRIHTKISVQALFRSPSQTTIVGASESSALVGSQSHNHLP